MQNLLGLQNRSLPAVCKHAFHRASDTIVMGCLSLQAILEREEGQDLVEYALVVALIAFGATLAMKGLSSEIKTSFNTISSNLGSSL